MLTYLYMQNYNLNESTKVQNAQNWISHAYMYRNRRVRRTCHAYITFDDHYLRLPLVAKGCQTNLQSGKSQIANLPVRKWKISYNSRKKAF